MAFDWNGYLIFAKNLNNTPAFIELACNIETIDRNIVSRAYYAAFHYARIYAETNSHKKFPRDSIHDEVRIWLWNHDKRGISNDLREFSLWRNQCDYDDNVDDLPKLVRNSIKMAGKILHAF